MTSFHYFFHYAFCMLYFTHRKYHKITWIRWFPWEVFKHHCPVILTIIACHLIVKLTLKFISCYFANQYIFCCKSGSSVCTAKAPHILSAKKMLILQEHYMNQSLNKLVQLTMLGTAWSCTLLKYKLNEDTAWKYIRTHVIPR